MTRWLRTRLVLDRAVAAGLLLVLAPVIAACAGLVRRHDGGPAFITVARVGRGGAPLAMWKLRSMRAEGPGGRASGAALTVADDDRITPIGARLRAYHLDELPQLYHVARGEMCLLGPRPEAPDFVDHEDGSWQDVLQAPPGIAGPSQLVVGEWERRRISSSSGAGAYVREVLPAKLAIDAWYLHHASPRLDLLIASTLLRRLGGSVRGDRLRALVHADVPEAGEVDP